MCTRRGLWRDGDEELKVGRRRCLNERIPSVGGDNPVPSSDLIEVGGCGCSSIIGIGGRAGGRVGERG